MSIDLVPIVALGLVVYALTNFAKFLTNRDWKSAVTLIVAWVIGVLAVWLLGATIWGAQINVGDQTLDLLSFWDKVVAGLVVASSASFGYDLKRSFDGSDSAATPPMVPPPGPKQPGA
jgi:hypothetical protein